MINEDSTEQEILDFILSYNDSTYEKRMHAYKQIPQSMLQKFADIDYKLDRKEFNKHVQFFKHQKQEKHVFGDYELVIQGMTLSESCALYCKGTVYRDGKVITIIDRNYSSFPFLFVKHANGHDYLVCGEDYQCLTIVELDTGKQHTKVDPFRIFGHGFCGYEFSVSPDTNLLCVVGCMWAAPQEIFVYDFTNPMDTGCWFSYYHLGTLDDDVLRWRDNETLEIGRKLHVVRDDSKQAGVSRYDADLGELEKEFPTIPKHEWFVEREELKHVWKKQSKYDTAVFAFSDYLNMHNTCEFAYANYQFEMYVYNFLTDEEREKLKNEPSIKDVWYKWDSREKL